MLEGLRAIEGGDTVLPFVSQFYSSASTYIWEDDVGVVHDVVQGEGGEQGDPLMPALFALGQHRALVAVQERLRPDEHLLAFLGRYLHRMQAGSRCPLPRHVEGSVVAPREHPDPPQQNTGLEPRWCRTGEHSNPPAGCPYR